MRHEVLLEDALEALIDHRGRTPKKLGAEFVPAGVQVISAQNITENRLDLDATTRFVHTSVADRWMKTPLQPGDVLLSSEAPLGCVAVVGAEHGHLCLGQRLFALRGRRGLLDGRYLAAALKCDPVRARLRARASGTTAQGIRQAELRKVLLPLPRLAEQRAIADVLGALDDKIESNRRLADACDATWLWHAGHALRNAEPVSVQVLVDEGILVVNDGYRAKNSELAAEGMAFVRAGNLTDQGLDLTGADRVPPDLAARVGNKRSVAWDTAFTSKGTVGRITLVGPDADTFVYSPQVCFWRSLGPERLSPFVLHAWMRSARFVAQIDAVKGQTDMADYVSLRDQRAMRFDLPEPRVQREVAGLAEPLARAASAARKEARTLTSIRDALLPKLVAGHIRVPLSEEVEDQLGAASEALA